VTDFGKFTTALPEYIQDIVPHRLYNFPTGSFAYSRFYYTIIFDLKFHFGSQKKGVLLFGQYYINPVEITVFFFAPYYINHAII
jgi:hypothetical protein